MPYMKKVSDTVRDLKIRKKIQKTKPVLDDTIVKAYLEEFHKKYVVVPIDKASNNVAIICKKFYVSRLLEEVGVLNTTSSISTPVVSLRDPY